MVAPLHELLRPVPGILQGSMRCTPNGGSFPGRLETGLPELRVVGGTSVPVARILTLVQQRSI